MRGGVGRTASTVPAGLPAPRPAGAAPTCAAARSAGCSAAAPRLRSSLVLYLQGRAVCRVESGGTRGAAAAVAAAVRRRWQRRHTPPVLQQVAQLDGSLSSGSSCVPPLRQLHKAGHGVCKSEGRQVGREQCSHGCRLLQKARGRPWLLPPGSGAWSGCWDAPASSSSSSKRKSGLGAAIAGRSGLQSWGRGWHRLQQCDPQPQDRQALHWRAVAAANSCRPLFTRAAQQQRWLDSAALSPCQTQQRLLNCKGTLESKTGHWKKKWEGCSQQAGWNGRG